MKSKAKRSLLTFTVDRSKWRCGRYGRYRNGQGETVLLNLDGYQCCLGFACRTVGFKPHQIKNYGTPDTAYSCASDPVELRANSKALINKDGCNTHFTIDAMDINDNSITTQETKEKQLIALGKKHRVNVKFIGKYEN